MANSLRDQNDPEQIIHRQMIEFSRSLKDKLGETMFIDTKRTKTILTSLSLVYTMGCGLLPRTN